MNKSLHDFSEEILIKQDESSSERFDRLMIGIRPQDTVTITLIDPSFMSQAEIFKNFIVITQVDIGEAFTQIPYFEENLEDDYFQSDNDSSEVLPDL